MMHWGGRRHLDRVKLDMCRNTMRTKTIALNIRMVQQDRREECRAHVSFNSSKIQLNEEQTMTSFIETQRWTILSTPDQTQRSNAITISYLIRNMLFKFTTLFDKCK